MKNYVKFKDTGKEIERKEFIRDKISYELAANEWLNLNSQIAKLWEQRKNLLLQIKNNRISIEKAMQFKKINQDFELGGKKLKGKHKTNYRKNMAHYKKIEESLKADCKELE